MKEEEAKGTELKATRLQKGTYLTKVRLAVGTTSRRNPTQGNIDQRRLTRVKTHHYHQRTPSSATTNHMKKGVGTRPYMIVGDDGHQISGNQPNREDGHEASILCFTEKTQTPIEEMQAPTEEEDAKEANVYKADVRVELGGWGFGKIIESNGAELRRLQSDIKNLLLHNWNLAHSNTLMLAELNLGRVRVRNEFSLSQDALIKENAPKIVSSKQNANKEKVKDNNRRRSRKYSGALKTHEREALQNLLEIEDTIMLNPSSVAGESLKLRKEGPRNSFGKGTTSFRCIEGCSGERHNFGGFGD
ncbi:hypothetical protein PIB30_016596 [Stylosanthes scabra]|uniref:Uncharacterized protein n=1 Tax=Stylosanthes scabra TaxID=79078 RepID=A0ABU6T8L2_9FABA|nr:hypothetical protein [Stylosanthes scabra]